MGRAMTALVVGGGPAGASAALGLLKAGVSVRVLEQGARWTGRVCGSFLNAEAVKHLEWLGIPAGQAAEAVPVKEAWVTSSGGRRTRASLAADGRTGLAVSRQVLEDGLRQAVEARGGQWETGRVLAFRSQGLGGQVKVRGPQGRTEDHRADLLVLADGRFSLAADAGPKPAQGWFGWNATFARVPQDPGQLSLHFFPGGYVGVLTFSDGKSNVCGLSFQRAGGRSCPGFFAEALAAQPPLRALLARAERCSPWRGVGPLPFGARLRRSRGILLAGDAAAVGDPFMGEGLGRALGAGPLIFEALRRAETAGGRAAVQQAYQELWMERYATRLTFGNIFRKVLNQRWALAGLMASFSSYPRMLQPLVNISQRH
jgi:menaquinone-9 beta-reductase